MMRMIAFILMSIGIFMTVSNYVSFFQVGVNVETYIKTWQDTLGEIPFIFGILFFVLSLKFNKESEKEEV